MYSWVWMIWIRFSSRLHRLCCVFYYSILDIEGEQRRCEWDCSADEFTAVWWDCQDWNMVSLFSSPFSCLTNTCAATQYLVVLPVLFHIRSDKSNKDVALAPFSLPLSLIRRWTLLLGSHSSLHCSALWTVCTSDIVSQVSHPVPGSEPSCCQPILLHPGPLLWPADPGTHPPGPAGCLEHCMALWDRKPPWKSEWSPDWWRWVSTSVSLCFDVKRFMFSFLKDF